MLKSVWLSSLIPLSFRDADLPLSSYYRHLCGVVRADRATLCLAEPDGDAMTYFLLMPQSACIVPAPDRPIDPTVLRRIMAARRPERCGDLLYCPLFFENVASFGALVFADVPDDPDADKLQKALIAFSTLLYAESMGSIVRSYHDTVMRAEEITQDFPHGKLIHRVLDGVSLSVCEKEFTVIVGASGSGKTTLLNILGGMRTPTSGRVFWHDTEVTAMQEKERTAYRGDTVGFVFQRYHLIDDLTAAENIKVAASLVRDPMKISEALAMVGLTDKARSYPSQLSGGEQQRVAIARALVKRAQILLCDEPTGALDTETAMQIVRILKGIAKEQGIPVVVITHNPNLVVLADHCITLKNGTVADDRIQPFSLAAEDLSLG